VIGSIIAAVVGANTALTSCTAQTVARHQSFRQAVDAEEGYWRDLYADYLKVFAKDVQPEEKEARLFALSVLAERPVPNFEEHSLGPFDRGGLRQLAIQRLSTMKTQLRESLERPESSTEAVSAKLRDQNWTSAVANIRTAQDRASPDGQTEVDQLTQVQADGPISYQPRTLALGSSKGWDIDVFWCGGGGPSYETVSFSEAMSVASVLADRSSSKSAVGGQALGRIRLILLPESKQGGIYPVRGSGSQIRPERKPAEVRLASQIRAMLPAGNRFAVVPSDTVTPWYLSLFICPAPGTSPATALPLASSAR
jgi:hypothetical protein